jgi:hypothetical protein
MNCEKYEPLIALEVEDDLPPRDAVKLAAHLKLCRACREFAAEMRSSQAAVHLLGQAEFSEAVYADLRRSVMNEVAVRSAGPDYWRRLFGSLGWQYAALAGLSALLLLSAMFYLKRPDPKPVVADNQNQTRQNLPDVKPETGKDSEFQQKKPVQQRHNEPASRAKFVKAPEPESHNDVAVVRPLPEPEPMNSTEEADDDRKIRMEIQTRDPNIRIIWFLNKEPRRTASD